MVNHQINHMIVCMHTPRLAIHENRKKITIVCIYCIHVQCSWKFLPFFTPLLSWTNVLSHKFQSLLHEQKFYSVKYYKGSWVGRNFCLVKYLGCTVFYLCCFLSSRTLFLFSFITFTAWVALGGNLAYLVVSWEIERERERERERENHNSHTLAT